MATKTNVTSVKFIVKPQSVTLSNGASVEVPDGADAGSFKRYAEAKLKLAANPRKVSRKPASRKPSKRSQYARMQSVLGQATLELVERVNRPVETQARFVNGNLEVW